MAIKGVDTKCYILALFVRDDGERFLLGSGHYEFKDTQMHFAANAIQNDIVEVQGNDGFLLAGQVRRPGTQSFDGYVGDGTMSKEETESYRRQFFSFFRKNFFYKVIYVFSDGTAIQRKSGFLVDDPTVEELYQMYPEYHVALNFEDVNYYSYSEDEEGQEQYAKEATIDISSMRATGGLVWDNLGVVWENPWSDPVTVSGTEIQIENEAGVRAPIENLELQGDTSQQTYSGKNLLRNNYGSAQTVGGITFTKNTDGTITANGTATAGLNFYPGGSAYYSIPAGTYTLSDGLPNPTSSTYFLYVDAPTPGQFMYFNTAEGTVTRTLPEGTTIRPRIVIRQGQTLNDVIFKPMLEAGSIATSFEPYVGGIPAPNPDYPQNVQVVTGEQTVEVHGKNLFPLGTGSYTNHGFTSIYNADGSITVSGIADASYADLTASRTVNYEQGKTYTVSITEALPCRFGLTALGYGAQREDINIAEGIKSGKRTFNYTHNSAKLYIYNLTVGQSYNFTIYPMVEEGSTATDYQPYQSQSYTIDLGDIELCNIGNYQDKVFNNDPNEDWYDPDLEDNAWYVHKAITKAIFNGTEDWAEHNIYNGIYGFKVGAGAAHSNSAVLASSYRAVLISEYNSNNRSYGTISSLESTTTSINYNLFLTQPNSTISNLSSFTTWLSTNNITTYYASETPTDTKITDANLVGQLNALGAMRLVIGENNLIVQTTGTNLPAPLRFKYYTTVAMTGAEWEEGGSGGATVVEVDSITNTYPIWRVKGPAVDPQLSVINTNTTIRYTGTVTSTQTLEIDMFNKTAKLNGVSVIGNVSGDWVSLAPGTNRVIYTAENADAQPSTIEWQEVVG